MKKVLLVVGPTAIGKTSLAKRLSSKFNGAMLNADSRQVYKDLNVISGKDIPSETPYKRGFYILNGIKLYLFDLVKPSEDFSVNKYLDFAVPLIEEISKQNILPVVTGGTGFYIKALIDGVETVNIPPNLELRKNLEKASLKELQEELENRDPKKFKKLNNSDVSNKRRLIRAIEISELKNKGHINLKKLEGYDFKIIGLKAEPELIKKRIDKRINERLENGALEEAKSLFNDYDKLSEQVKTSIGYRELFEFLKKTLILGEAIEKWRISEYQLVKKQMTWFKKDKRIDWFDINNSTYIKKVEASVGNWYNGNNA